MSSEIHQKTFEDHYYESERLNVEARARLVKLQEELSQSRKLIVELVKMGEFYQDKAHWGNSTASIDPCDTYHCEHQILRGGKLARSVLSNNKDLIEKLTKG